MKMAGHPTSHAHYPRNVNTPRQAGPPANELSRLEQVALEEDDPARIQQKISAAGPAAKPVVRNQDKAWLVSYLLAFVALGGGAVLLGKPAAFLEAENAARILGYLRGAMAMLAVLAVARVTDVYAVGRIPNAASRFNLRRIVRLLTSLVLGLILLSVLFANWYSTVISLGLISLVLGFALQTPISSLIGWVYILVRVPYRVGDRIQMGEARGDVIDVSYLDTTLWEFGGDYLSTDHPSGRLIKFPNTRVLNEPVFNYSWPLFPYIWNEIKFPIAYECDLEFVATTMQQVTAAEIGESMKEKVKVYRELLAKTPVDQLDVQEQPTVLFRASENTWLEAIVRYLVHPKEAGKVKTDLTRKLLASLNAAPTRVLFPKSNAR